MSTLRIVVTHMPIHNLLEFSQIPCLGDQGADLGLNPTPHGLDPGVALGPVFRVGYHGFGVNKNQPEPVVTGVDRVLIMVDDDTVGISAYAFEGPTGTAPALPGKISIPGSTYGPTWSPLTGDIYRSHEPGLLRTSRVTQFGEIG